MDDAEDIEIWEFEFDHMNLRHFSRGFTAEVVWQVWADQPVILPNDPAETATHLMVGMDDSGILWTIAMLKTDELLRIWRPISGWPTEREQERAAWLGA